MTEIKNEPITEYDVIMAYDFIQQRSVKESDENILIPMILFIAIIFLIGSGLKAFDLASSSQ